MINKSLDYKFIPRCEDTKNQVKEFCRNDSRWKISSLTQNVVFAAEKKVKKTGWVKIYQDSVDKGKTTSGSIHFWGKANLGPEYRKMDMEKDVEAFVIGDTNSPTCASLNFEHSVVGSDEVGTSETMKQIVVSAVLVTPEDMESLLEWNVRDSKEMSENQLLEIGKALTGISKAEAEKIFSNGGRTFSSTKEKGALVNFCTVTIPNCEYNEFRKNNADKDKNNLLADLHAEVLNPLVQEYHPDYVVVDDFMENDVEVKSDFYKSLKCESDKVLLRIKADAYNMAASCASVISAYISALYMDWLNMKLVFDYNVSCDFKLPTGNESLTVLKKKLDLVGINSDEVLPMYAKESIKK